MLCRFVITIQQAYLRIMQAPVSLVATLSRCADDTESLGPQSTDVNKTPLAAFSKFLTTSRETRHSSFEVKQLSLYIVQAC